MNDTAARILADALMQERLTHDYYARRVEEFTAMIALHTKSRDESAERIAALEEALGEDAERLLATPLGEVMA